MNVIVCQIKSYVDPGLLDVLIRSCLLIGTPYELKCFYEFCVYCFFLLPPSGKASIALSQCNL